MIWDYEIGRIAYAVAGHFALGACSGLLAYWLTLTISRRIISSRSQDIQQRWLVFFTRHLPIVAGICFAVLVHVWWDYTFIWF